MATAREITNAELRLRTEKTAKLRALRLEKEATELPPVTKSRTTKTPKIEPSKK